MVCSDLQKALAPFLSSYEQVCAVADTALRTNGEFVSSLPEHMPVLWLETGEQHKSLQTVEHIWDFLFDHAFTRRGLMLSIGGGVLTDLAGFAAATYKRGVAYITIPTTLLAMVDASSGGKTGFNYKELKNSIGVFASPVETLIWPQWLRTLPAGQLLSGFGEMLKTGLIDNKQGLWEGLLRYDLERMDIAELTPYIDACVRVKEAIVAADPEEQGPRKVLNLGHTFGHALEELSLMESRKANNESLALPHGYAVVYGLIAELYLSVTRLGCPKEPLQQLTQLMLHYYGKPACKCSDRERLIALMQQDKKNERAAEINCTLLRQIGEPVINQVITPDEASEALDYLFSL